MSCLHIRKQITTSHLLQLWEYGELDGLIMQTYSPVYTSDCVVVRKRRWGLLHPFVPYQVVPYHTGVQVLNFSRIVLLREGTLALQSDLRLNIDVIIYELFDLRQVI